VIGLRFILFRVALPSLALAVVWLAAGRRITLLLDRLFTVPAATLPSAALEYDGGGFRIGGLLMSFGKIDNLRYPLEVRRALPTTSRFPPADHSSRSSLATRPIASNSPRVEAWSVGRRHSSGMSWAAARRGGSAMSITACCGESLPAQNSKCSGASNSSITRPRDGASPR